MAEGKEKVKHRLGLERARYLVFIGRLQPRKQIPYLLDVYALLKRKCGLDLGVLIIGKGDQAPLRAQAAELGVADVHFLGALTDEEAGAYLFASDVMVMPGWLGLAVNHAFVFGLPVVTQRFGKSLVGHGPEATYVEHGVTGWFAREGDKEGMAQGIVEILKHREEYSMRVFEYVEKYLRIERMVEGFAEAVAQAKSCRPSG
jgi:glycosyltransferase involved in cell wall biosynthesis